MADDTATLNTQPEKRATRITVTLPPEDYQRLTLDLTARLRRVFGRRVIPDQTIKTILDRNRGAV